MANEGLLTRKTIRQALRRTDRSQELGQLPVAALSLVERRRMAAGYSPTPVGYGVALRDLLGAAVGELKPKEGSEDFFEKSWRPFLILSQQYLLGRSPGFLAEQMGIARSTYDHAQASALDTLVDLLRGWEHHGIPSSAPLLPGARPEGNLPAFNIPSRPPHPIVGRERPLQELRNLLLQENGGASVAISGLPGVGKTTLAKELAHDPLIRERFKDGILWAGLGRNPDFSGVMTLWAITLRLPLEVFAEMGDPTEQARVLQATIGMGEMLLIIDDVWEAAHGRALQMGGPRCAHLFTSRLPGVAVDLAGDNNLALQELEAEQGLKLLESFTPGLSEEASQQTQELVHAVDGLPLGLVLVGKHLQKAIRTGQRRRIHDTLSGLHEAKQRFSLIQAHSPLTGGVSLPSNTPVSLGSVIDLSIQGLSARTQTALQALSLFPSKPNTFSEQAALALEGVLVEGLDELVDLGLLEVAALDRYTLHRSVVDFVRLGEVEAAVVRSYLHHFAGFIQEHIDRHPAYGPESANILAGFDCAEDHSLWEDFFAGINAYYPHLEAVGSLDVAHDLLNRAEVGAREQADTYWLAVTLGNLGKASIRRSQLDLADGYYREGLSLANEEDDPALLCIMHRGLGVITYLRGEFEAAHEHYETGIELARGADLRAELSGLLANMGSLEIAAGKFESAEGRFEQALKLSRAIDERSILRATLTNLGVLAGRHWELGKAEAYFQEALELARSSGNLRDILYLTSNLGALAHQSGDVIKAWDQCQEGLALAREVGDRAQVCKLLANLGSVATQEGKHEQAEEFLREGLEVARELGQKELLLQLLINAGVLEREREDFETAEKTFTEARELAGSLGHRRFLCVLHYEHGELGLGRGDLEGAEKNYQLALEGSRELGLKDYKGLSLFGLAKVSEEKESMQNALLHVQESLELLEAIRHPKAEEVKGYHQKLKQLHRKHSY